MVPLVAETLYEYVLQTLICFVCIFVVDMLTPIRESARWFYLHTCINAFVCLFSVPDILTCLGSPYHCYDTHWSTSFAFSLAAAGHLYHTVFWWSKLRYADYLHHISMILIALPITCYYQPLIGSQIAVFGLTGLPGGLDYLLLTLVKIDKLDYIREKELNVTIQVWVRVPVLLLGDGLWLQAYIMGELPWQTIIIGFLQTWNALYFMHDTLKSFYSKYYVPPRSK
eukprot:TRINITY_DN9038_c0_g1_i1.p1 TRINITY_DN9038_c0_g1~~TRINITY_DN9038_c0_g1_i1.p1  ORF type:complete len:226 (-),score=24.91 TRINITY_DN9038_c0_g1_i1:16-693(-)